MVNSQSEQRGPWATVAGGCALSALLSLALMGTAPLEAQDFQLGSPESLADLNEHFGAAVYPYARRGAQPLGITGFEIYGEIAGDQELADEAYGALIDDLPSDLLIPVRVGIRKGLLGGFDVGVSWTRVLDLDYEAFSVELQKALFKPTVLKPGLGLRLAYSDGDAGDVYSLKQYGAELILSKGFTVVSVFGGAGLIRSEGDFLFSLDADMTDQITFGASSTQTVLFAGVRINLLLPKFTFAVEKTEAIQGVFKVAIGW